MIKKVLIPINELGHPIGQAHHRSILSDEQVDLMRDLYEEGLVGYRTLAKMFGTNRNTVKDIVKYRRRVGTIDRYRPAFFDKEGNKVKCPPGVHKGDVM